MIQAKVVILKGAGRRKIYLFLGDINDRIVWSQDWFFHMQQKLHLTHWEWGELMEGSYFWNPLNVQLLASENWKSFLSSLENVFVFSYSTHSYDALIKHFCQPGLLLTLTPDFIYFANAQLSKCDFLLFVA